MFLWVLPKIDLSQLFLQTFVIAWEAEEIFQSFNLWKCFNLSLSQGEKFLNDISGQNYSDMKRLRSKKRLESMTLHNFSLDKDTRNN